MILRTREVCFNTPKTGKFVIEEETKVGDGSMSVRIRLVPTRGIIQLEDMVDPTLRRRYQIYEKWLIDVRKSGLIDKQIEGIELPSRCPQLASREHEIDFGYTFKGEDLESNHFLRNLFDLARKTVQIVVYGDVAKDQVAGSGQGKHKTDEQMLHKIRLIQTNQYFMFFVLFAILLYLLFARSSTTAITGLACPSSSTTTNHLPSSAAAGGK